MEGFINIFLYSSLISYSPFITSWSIKNYQGFRKAWHQIVNVIIAVVNISVSLPPAGPQTGLWWCIQSCGVTQNQVKGCGHWVRQTQTDRTTLCLLTSPGRTVCLVQLRSSYTANHRLETLLCILYTIYRHCLYTIFIYWIFFFSENCEVSFHLISDRSKLIYLNYVSPYYVVIIILLITLS